MHAIFDQIANNIMQHVIERYAKAYASAIDAALWPYTMSGVKFTTRVVRWPNGEEHMYVVIGEEVVQQIELPKMFGGQCQYTNTL